MSTKPKRWLIHLLAILAALATALAASPAGAERLRIIPVPPNVVAQWTPMPDLPQVSYAPNLPTDVFRHRGRYYFYWEGIWYQSKNIKGPWTRLQHPPAILSRIQTAYFKTVPRGVPQPPGAAVPGAPPPEGLVTPEGTPAVPPPPMTPQPAPPVPPAPPSGAYAPSPQAVPPAAPVTPPQPPETSPPPEQATPPPPPETQESAPQAVPEGTMPKAM
jgi:hypothetical protein